MKFERQFFQKIEFTPNQIQNYLDSAKHDLSIAKQSDIPDVVFKFSYDSFVKIGITLIASYNYRVRSNTGHHIKIIEKTSQILNDETILILGNRMRKERNLNLYDGIVFISDKESSEYLDFVEQVFKKVKKVLRTA